LPPRLGGLIEEVIYNILYTANLKPIEERIDFKKTVTIT